MLIFVYGTLRRGQGAYRGFHLEERTKFLGEVRIPGKMYDHGYPGVVFGEHDDGTKTAWAVLGDVLEIVEGEEDLEKTLDGYEGVPSLYSKVMVQTPYGEALAYQINRPNVSMPIPDGDYIRHKTGVHG